ncbi:MULTISPECIES: hypothetical protein [Kitasatospora]|uniref:Exo-alpha-sialidase n=1 Tax=Kitasatospora cathayae TaxID=3004092 RepID=A0ABY7QD08_9ACTN|nr:hypothetical protein [Kitasatospora sp. HUAS 3-15]WBP90556.1 hypothetical protein O1G21_34970 [Kitasatospora sp. HUAS 3-15]
MPTIKVVNITPRAQSGDANLDGEPNLAVNPENPQEMVATAFTPDPLGGPRAPVYVSTDGGNTWVLNSVVPGDAPGSGTGDISVGFAARGGTLYAGILNGDTDDLEILRATNITSTTPMTVLERVSSQDMPDQPWVVTGTAAAGNGGQDVVYVGKNTLGNAPQTAMVAVSANARTGTGAFADVNVDQRPATTPQDGPPIRLAAHPGGQVVYAAFENWTDFDQRTSVVTFDVVVTRDDNGGLGPFKNLADPGGAVGRSVVSGRTVPFNVHVASLGQERTGADLSIAVDPNDADSVWIAWCDGFGGTVPTDYVLHVQHSGDGGKTWAEARQDLINAKNPSLAVNSDGLVGLVYQQLAENQWTTTLELTSDGFKTMESHVLHQAPGNVPKAPPGHLPYLGDYIRMLAVGKDFYGVFVGNNTPDNANFPVGVTYQRNANFTTHQLFALDGVTRVPPSLDPFFFHRAA